jgi:hypothetical protein
VGDFCPSGGPGSRHTLPMPLFGRRESPRAQDKADLETLSDDELVDRYRALDKSIEGDDPDRRGEELDRIAVELLSRHPEAKAFWCDRGMYAKWRQDWSESVRLNRAALDLVPPGERAGEAAAWNLGIAATAQRDWSTARFAWSQFGITLPQGESADSPIAASFGLAPVRLNAEPRFVGQELPVLDGRTWATEVVWGERLCPARIWITNVPTPESGHRFGDVVLHDGDTLGSRMLGDREVGVFNEITVWERSPSSTLTATVQAPDEEAITDLVELFHAVGAVAEDWTQGMQVLCRACSEGSSGASHTHSTDDRKWLNERSVGMAGRPQQVRDRLDDWVARGALRSYTDLEVALE